MTIPEDAQEVLDFCEPLAPACLGYLDFATLGSENERIELVEMFADHYRERRGPNRTITPRTYARRIIDPLDDVTVNLLRPALWGEKYHSKLLNKVRRESQEGPYKASGMAIRNYLLLLYAARDLEQKSGTQRQFHGLHEIVPDERNDSDRLRYINLGTDDDYRAYVALFRYAVAVSNGVEFSEEQDYFITKSDDVLVIYPEVKELILERPDDVDRIARIVIERESQSVDMIRSVLADSATAVLDNGAL